MDRKYRQSMAPGAVRSSAQSLAEDLEKTEQSITLCLQEIDRNFTAANRIVSETILPSIEKYASETQQIWQDVGFWKHFLESSADVSLSTFEELAIPLDELSISEETINHDQTEIKHEEDDNSPRMAQTTPLRTQPPGPPRTGSPASKIPQLVDRLKTKSPHRSPLKLSNATVLTHPSARAGQDVDMSSPAMTPQRNQLRHQVLDKNWRLQVTPRVPSSTRFDQQSTQRPPVTSVADHRPPISSLLAELDDSLTDIVVPPNLQSGLFSPIAKRGGSGLSPQIQRTVHQYSASPDTPSMVRESAGQHKYTSTSTPARQKPPSHLFEEDEGDSDIDQIMDGMSPPVTIHFGRGRAYDAQLLRTPAKQAANIIVDDILRSVGAGTDDSSSMLSHGSYMANTGVEGRGDGLDESDMDSFLH